jgi:hypothetical protein
MTTSHLTSPAKDAGQVIGYGHSTRLPKFGSQMAGYEQTMEEGSEKLSGIADFKF